jgi:hypothetical protein
MIYATAALSTTNTKLNQACLQSGKKAKVNVETPRSLRKARVIPITVGIYQTQWVWANTYSGYIFASPRIPITIR